MSRLELKHLSKRIGREPIVRDVSLDVRPGEIFGFLGPNGSGKTTTIRMILRLIRPSGGTILVDGIDVRSRAHRRAHVVGAQIDPPGTFPYLTGRDHLLLTARLLGAALDRRGADAILEQVDLLPAATKPVRAYSQGMTRKLGVAMTLVGNPRLVILDEPTAGLDPLGIREVRAILRNIVADGERSVFVSSHLLSETESECHRIGLLSRGQLVALGPVDELLQGEERVLELQTGDVAAAHTLLGDAFPERTMRRDGDRLIVEGVEREQVPMMVRALAVGGVAVFGAAFRRLSLEEYFVRMTVAHQRDAAPGRGAGAGEEKAA